MLKSENQKSKLFAHLKQDLPSSVVVFFVALPLCLGIALASGAPLFSGLLAGIVGGIVVGMLSGSQLGVSGPAAGLAVIVLNAITDLGGFEIFLVAVVLAGVIQLLMGYAKAGIIAYFFPSSVIYGMLSGIGIIIFMKQVPHALGYDKDPEGDLQFTQADGQNTFSELFNMLEFVNPSVVIITLVSLVILLSWETSFMKDLKFTQLIPGPLLAVISGVLLNVFFSKRTGWEISKDHLVNVPDASSVSDFFGNFSFPDFTALANPEVYMTAVVIAIVASLETLLCVEAADKLDPMKRVTPTNRELKAQGIGNVVSGLIGGLPITQVIVRSSANVQAGGKTKISAIFHGILILVSVVLIPGFLKMVPLATLAAILLIVGYKLAKPSVFKKMYSQGSGQFIPFLVTIAGIVFIDLLWGLGIGLTVAIFVILKNNYEIPYLLKKEKLAGQEKVTISLAQEVTFLNKASVLKALDEIPPNTKVVIDASINTYMHYDVVEIIDNFKITAVGKQIDLEVVGFNVSPGDTPPAAVEVKS